MNLDAGRFGSLTLDHKAVSEVVVIAASAKHLCVILVFSCPCLGWSEGSGEQPTVILETPVYQLPLPSTLKNSLEVMGVKTLGQLAQMPEVRLRSTYKIGERSIAKIKALTTSCGLRLGYQPGRALRDQYVEILELPLGICMSLANKEVETIGQLTVLTEKEIGQVLLKIPGGLQMVQAAFARHNLSFGEPLLTYDIPVVAIFARRLTDVFHWNGIKTLKEVTLLTQSEGEQIVHSALMPFESFLSVLEGRNLTLNQGAFSNLHIKERLLLFRGGVVKPEDLGTTPMQEKLRQLRRLASSSHAACSLF